MTHVKTRLASAVRLGIISSPNRELEHVPAFSHSNRWVGVGQACSDAWIVAGEIRRGQGNRDYRRKNGSALGPAQQKPSSNIPRKSKNRLQIAWPMRPSRPVCPARRFRWKTCNPMKPSLQRPRTGGCDLIVMASHGCSGLSAVVLGSATNKVLTYTKVPMLVIQRGSSRRFPRHPKSRHAGQKPRQR